ncbi:MAG: hypothetical protein IJE23_01180 [Tyzzerella sp.]|nr:hypothetical protein [Tyzzerella sp.]
MSQGLEDKGMNSLPEISDVRAIQYEYFPARWQAVVWRNWGYVPVKRIAAALGTSCEEIQDAAATLGLNPKEQVNEAWEKRGYLTIIRNNWHLCTYKQILTLLNISAEELAFILKEDDFMWIKLGSLKPLVDAPKYTPLTDEELQQTKKIVELLKDRFPAGYGKRDNAFAFVEEFHKPVCEAQCVPLQLHNTENLRMIYPYFALYGDALIDESIDPLPERILKEYADAGINGIWMQMVLYQLVEFPFEPSLSKGWEKRIESLRKLVAKAKKYGIGIYPYLNEPRAMSDAFFQKYPELRGESEGDFYAMCTSTKEVQTYLYQSVKHLFEMVPDLAGFFTITMSENLTNCYSRSYLAEKEGTGNIDCPRCSERKPWEVVAEVNNLMAKGAHDVNPDVKAIAWTWGWPDEWAEKVVPLLTEGQILQCTSEEAMKFCIGGVEGSVLDYTMSLCGPGEKAKKMWKVAREHGLQMSAKVQMNNTWEMTVVPYIPVLEKVATHIKQLKEQGIQHLQVSWTLGGCPSPNLRLAEWLMEDRGTLKDFLGDWLGENIAEGVFAAQQRLCNAFSHYPFHMETLYFGPQNSGPMAPFFLENTGYRASMVGYPYDDINGWRSIYPADVYEDEYRQLVKGWEEGTTELLVYMGQNGELDDMILMAQVVLCQYESAYHHIQFVNRRDKMLENTVSSAEEKEKLQCEMLRIVREEMETVQTLIDLRLQDSRIGFESSNHYFYTLQDLKEKMINLAYCEKKLAF